MLGALLIVFREVLEAGLIIGIVLAASKGVHQRGRYIGLGIGLGVLGACLLAAFAGQLSALFQGSGQELFNAGVLFFAVVMLAWHNIWMATHGREMAASARTLGQEVLQGRRSLFALAGVVMVAVLREGSEVVLFLYSLITSTSEKPGEVWVGSLLGLAGGALSTLFIYRGLVAIPLRHFFSVTSWFITFLAAGLAAQAVLFLQLGGYVDRWSAPLWDTSAFLAMDSWVGRALHVLIGYTDRPNVLQISAYLVTLLVISVATRLQSAH